MRRRSGRSALLIHAACLTPRSWDGFRGPLEAAGFEVHAPAWPLVDARPAARQRAAPAVGLGRLGLDEIVAHYARYARALDEPPLLIGHSVGGLIVQRLIDQGVGRAGVAIAPTPIAGTVSGPASLAAALPVLARWRNWTRPYAPPFEAFARRFANTAPKAMQRSVYEDLVVPTSGRVLLQAATGWGARIRPGRRRLPLLILCGSEDRIVAPYLARRAYERQRRSGAPTAFQVMPGLSHLMIAEPGFERVTDAIIAWACGAELT